ncbi:MAG: YARHG domain-containing protein [Clostridia bacterium]|nr:YARHG domain-containing protein [Clostridia bacterium]
MKKLCALLAAILSLSLILPLVGLADELYIIPDSNTRLLTYDELWNYQYDTLMYAFNEIYARHGYKFETGSRCWMWFTQMPWYTPNESENSKNHHETYAACSSIENKNVDLIKQVRADMKAMNTKNPTGKGLPTPPSNVNKPRGFNYVSLSANQTLPVYTAPSYSAYRANNGKAACSTNGAVYALGWDNGWMLMLYEANAAGQYRVGYVNSADIKKGKLPSLPYLAWENQSCTVLTAATLTDDPALTGKALTTLPAGTTVVYLTTMVNSGTWDYVETYINGQTARGFVPHGTLDLSYDDDTIY